MLPPLRAREVKIKAVAIDFAGNVGESDVVLSKATFLCPEVYCDVFAAHEDIVVSISNLDILEIEGRHWSKEAWYCCC